MNNYALKPRKVNKFSDNRSLFYSRRKRRCIKHSVNEYFNSSVSWQKRVMQLFFIFIGIYCVYFFFFSSYFRITNIVVEGNNEIPTSEIEMLSRQYLEKNHLLIFSNNNYFFFSRKSLESQISSKYFLDYLKIKKQKISTISIVIKERPASVLYKLGDREFLSDRDGVILSDAVGKQISKDIIKLIEIPERVVKNQNEINEQNKIIINDPQYSNTSSTVFIYEDQDGNKVAKEVPRIIEIFEDSYPEIPEIGKNYFDKDFVGKLIYLKDNYSQKFSRINIDHFEYKKSKPYFVTLVTQANFEIYLKLDSDIDAQLLNLYKYIVDEKNYDTKGIEYIDLKYKDQIIIK